MDQQDWNGIYTELESDVEALARRGGPQASDIEIYRQIDRVRFAIDKGEHARAIEIIEDIKRRLAGQLTRGGPALPSLETLDALEDHLIADARLGSARLELVGEDEVVLPETRAASQNTKVNKSIKFEDIADEYAAMFDSARIRPDKLDDVRWYSNRVVAGREVYEKIEARTRVPWYFVGLIHGMECSFSLAKHLHNGDSLKSRTWQVPAGRPKDGSPPFTFEDSACDALAYDNLAGQADWSLSRMLHRLEIYNGFGYRKKFGTASPYLWSYSNHFTSGKYVKDGVYDPNATSKQCGAAVMLRDLVERGVVAVGPVVAPQPVPAPQPAAQPEPVAQPQPAAQPQPVPAPAAEAPPAPGTPASVPPANEGQPAAPPGPASGDTVAGGDPFEKNNPMV
jgi:lysozyme family protein